MAINSFYYFLFLIVVGVFYYILPKQYQWIVLLISSIAFYIISTGKLVFYLVVTTTATFIAGLLLEKLNKRRNYQANQQSNEIQKQEEDHKQKRIKKAKKIVFSTCLLITFGILAFVKYSAFFIEITSSLLPSLYNDFDYLMFDYLLPLGISFYTFQSIGYIFDVYRKKIKAERNFGKFALFVSFFPQIIQGPISRYNELANQMYVGHKFDYTQAKFGLQLMLWGLFKKMVIADRAKIIVNTVFNNYKEHNGIIIFIGVALYSLQVYSDFSGGIDIVRGVAQLLGITLPQNFRQPFFATSIEDYWRRWHITLGSWMRDYVLYPLSLSRSFTKIGRFTRKILGNNLGKYIPTFVAMMITFILIGVWHGPDWKFIAYGIYNGSLIILGILMSPILNVIIKKFNIRITNFSWRLFKISGTFFLTTIGRYFSRASNLWSAVNMMGWTVRRINPWVFFDGTLNNLGLDTQDLNLLIASIMVLMLVDIFHEKGFQLRQKISEQNLVFRWSFYMAAIFSIIIFGIYGIGYESSDFIYKGF